MYSWRVFTLCSPCWMKQTIDLPFASQFHVRHPVFEYFALAICVSGGQLQNHQNDVITFFFQIFFCFATTFNSRTGVKHISHTELNLKKKTL